MNIPAPLQRWIEIDLDALTANCLEVRRHIGDKTRLMAVVKANSYGMGAVECARVFEQHADMLAVTTIEEGMELRNNGILASILVLTPACEAELPFYVNYRLTPCIDSVKVLQTLNELQQEAYPLHIEIDTGMNRTGISTDEGIRLLQMAEKMENVRVEGVFSHLASAAAKNKTSAKAQLKRFESFLALAQEQGLGYGMAHLANSAATLSLPESRYDMVRVGTLLYGQSPCALPGGWRLENPWSVKARVLAVHEVSAGETVGYGDDFKAKKPMKVGIVGIGYCDGFTMEPHARSVSIGSACREFANSVGRLLLKKPKYYAIYNGKRLGIIGRVSMQLTIIDIGGTDIACGSVVELPMRRIASNAMLCRVYKKNGEISDIYSIIGLQIQNPFAAAAE